MSEPRRLFICTGDGAVLRVLATDGGWASETVLDGRVASREYLSLTISVDHDLVDGAPATRFTQRLKELLESGYGLDDSWGDITQERGHRRPGCA